MSDSSETTGASLTFAVAKGKENSGVLLTILFEEYGYEESRSRMYICGQLIGNASSTKPALYSY